MISKSKYQINKIYKHEGGPYYYVKIKVGTDFYIIAFYGEFPDMEFRKYGEYTEHEVDDFLDTFLA